MRYMIYFADGARMIVRIPFVIRTITMACVVAERNDVIKFINF